MRISTNDFSFRKNIFFISFQFSLPLPSLSLFLSLTRLEGGRETGIERETERERMKEKKSLKLMKRNGMKDTKIELDNINFFSGFTIWRHSLSFSLTLSFSPPFSLPPSILSWPHTKMVEACLVVKLMSLRAWFLEGRETEGRVQKKRERKKERGMEKREREKNCDLSCSFTWFVSITRITHNLLTNSLSLTSSVTRSLTHSLSPSPSLSRFLPLSLSSSLSFVILPSQQVSIARKTTRTDHRICSAYVHDFFKLKLRRLHSKISENSQKFQNSKIWRKICRIWSKFQSW